MAKTRLTPGTLGKISITTTDNGRWQANAYLCDHQGQQHRLRARGNTPDQAVAALHTRANERLTTNTIPLHPHMTLGEAIDVWKTVIDTKTNTLSPRTRTLYKTWGNTVAATAGNLKLSELTTGTCNALIQRIQQERGTPAASNCKKALSLILGMAARSDAVPRNFIRDTERLDGAKKIESALTPPPPPESPAYENSSPHGASTSEGEYNPTATYSKMHSASQSPPQPDRAK